MSQCNHYDNHNQLHWSAEWLSFATKNLLFEELYPELDTGLLTEKTTVSEF
nr:hypothetical protein [uncultured Vibrio sp.]